MLNASIALRQLRFEFEIEAGEDWDGSPIEMDPELKAELLHILAEELGRIDPGKSTLTIPQLTLFTEPVTWKEFHKEFPRSFRAALRMELSIYAGLKGQMQTRSATESLLLAWQHFLARGYLPWWFRPTGTGPLKARFEQLWNQSGHLLAAWVQQQRQQPQVLQRFSRYGGEVVLADLLRYYLRHGQWPVWGMDLVSLWFPVPRSSSERFRDHYRLFQILQALRASTGRPAQQIVGRLWKSPLVRQRIVKDLPDYLLYALLDLIFSPAIPAFCDFLQEMIRAMSPPLTLGTPQKNYWTGLVRAMAQQGIGPDGRQPEQTVGFCLEYLTKVTHHGKKELVGKLIRDSGRVGQAVRKMWEEGWFAALEGKGFPLETEPVLPIQQAEGLLVFDFIRRRFSGDLSDAEWEHLHSIIRNTTHPEHEQSVPGVLSRLIYYYALHHAGNPTAVLNRWAGGDRSQMSAKAQLVLDLILDHKKEALSQVDQNAVLLSPPFSPQGVMVTELVYVANRILPLRYRHVWNQYLKHLSWAEVFRGQRVSELFETLLAHAFPEGTVSESWGGLLLGKLSHEERRKLKVLPTWLKKETRRKAEIVRPVSDSSPSPKENQDQPLSLVSQVAEAAPFEAKIPSTPARNHSLEPAVVNEKIYIENSGLVLLWPFLGHYFDHVGLREQGSKSFKDEAASSRGVYLLQYLVDFNWAEPGEEEVPEYQLVLNKIMCGLAPSELVFLEAALTDQEKEAGQGLLQASMKEWPAMKATSLGGLQRSFLQRNGALEVGKDSWTLTVEKRGFDAVLDQVNWGFSIVNLPFNESTIYVEWR